METISLRNLFNLPPPSAPGAESSQAPGGALGRDQFLELLTIQLRHQDPLNPISNQEFAAQLAQFSALEQMEQIKETLQSDLLLSESVHNAMTTSMIGREVRVFGSTFAVDGDPGASAPRLFARGPVAGPATVTIRDASGAVVRTLATELGESTTAIAWDGLDGSGQPLAPGTYTFEVMPEGGDGETPPATTFIEDVVSTIRFEDGVTQILLATVPYTLADVVEIRA